mmetsp:Transcript_92884/g.220815  ORF Transcript_92884/g.220815 Transcript_92884/m.220815 type:complete len:230 (+) Transcript_92884:592-1281(+)
MPCCDLLVQADLEQLVAILKILKPGLHVRQLPLRTFRVALQRSVQHGLKVVESILNVQMAVLLHGALIHATLHLSELGLKFLVEGLLKRLLDLLYFAPVALVGVHEGTKSFAYTVLPLGAVLHHHGMTSFPLIDLLQQLVLELADLLDAHVRRTSQLRYLAFQLPDGRGCPRFEALKALLSIGVLRSSLLHLGPHPGQAHVGLLHTLLQGSAQTLLDILALSALLLHQL